MVEQKGYGRHYLPCQRRVAIWISEGSFESLEGKGISGAGLPAASLAQ